MSDFLNKYTYRVEWSQEDQTHLARCLEFPSLAVDGSSPEKALKEIKKVVAECIKWMEEEQEKIPEPLGLKKYSGKLILRMPTEVHHQVALKAAEQGTSINQYVLSKISG